MASITLENVTKYYGKVEAVCGISLDINDGEFIALLGPSGCGKSSTLRMIAGLEKITSGVIRFDGRPVNDIRARDRNVAMAFETYALYPTLTVFENIAFPLRSSGWPSDKVEQRVREVARAMELSRVLDRMPTELSGGQAQRVGLARALIRQPSVFLLDEPISHLDTRQRHRMREFIKRLHMELGYTMILVTHDQEDAMAMSDRIVVMHEGLIRQVGTPDEIYNNPADDFVAGFVGEPPMNFLDGTPVSSNGRWLFNFRGRLFPLPDWIQPSGNKLPPELLLAIRPFHIQVNTDPTLPYDIEGTTFLTETLLDFNIVSIDAADLRLHVVMPPSFTVPRREPVYLKFNPDFVRLYDKESGKAVHF